MGTPSSSSTATASPPRRIKTWRHRARLGASFILLASAALKLFPSNAITFSLLADPWLRGLVAALEVILAVSILLPGIGTRASRFTLAVAGAYGLLTAYLLATAQPICGCFGGWLAKSPWIHVLILSVLGMLLLLSLPPSETETEPVRG